MLATCANLNGTVWLWASLLLRYNNRKLADSGVE